MASLSASSSVLALQIFKRGERWDARTRRGKRALSLSRTYSLTHSHSHRNAHKHTHTQPYIQIHSGHLNEESCASCFFCSSAKNITSLPGIARQIYQPTSGQIGLVLISLVMLFRKINSSLSMNQRNSNWISFHLARLSNIRQTDSSLSSLTDRLKSIIIDRQTQVYHHPGCV